MNTYTIMKMKEWVKNFEKMNIPFQKDAKVNEDSFEGSAYNIIKHILANQGEYFPITSVGRADLEGMGYDISNVTDEQMERLASKMANAYLDQSYWIDLEIIADDVLKLQKTTHKQHKEKEIVVTNCEECSKK